MWYIRKIILRVLTMFCQVLTIDACGRWFTTKICAKQNAENFVLRPLYWGKLCHRVDKILSFPFLVTFLLLTNSSVRIYVDSTKSWLFAEIAGSPIITQNSDDGIFDGLTPCMMFHSVATECTTYVHTNDKNKYGIAILMIPWNSFSQM